MHLPCDDARHDQGRRGLIAPQIRRQDRSHGPSGLEIAQNTFAAQLKTLHAGAPLSSGLVAAANQWSAEVWSAAERATARPLDASELALAQRPVFICGAPRSGTTLLRDLLDGHPQLAVLPTESQFYTRMVPLLFARAGHHHACLLGREWLERLVLPPPHWLLGKEPGSSAYIRFAADFGTLCDDAAAPAIPSWPLAALALAYGRTRSPGGEMWVEKTPGHELHLTRMLRDFPQALVIHLVRSPIAVLASWKRWQAQRWDSWEAGRFSARILAPSYRLAAEAEPARHLVLAYEDLVADRAATMARVARFLRIRPSPALHQPTVAGRDAQSNSSFAGSRPQPGKILTRWEMLILRLTVGKVASRLGYTVTSET